MNTPLRTLELLDKPAITGGVMELVAWRKKNPWNWPRVVPKWFVEHKKEMSKMLTVTGTAEFTNDGKLLVMVMVIQPHWPAEHDMMERIVKLYESDKVTLEQGQLVLRRTMVVPAVEVPAVSAPETESGSNMQSGSVNEADANAQLSVELEEALKESHEILQSSSAPESTGAGSGSGASATAGASASSDSVAELRELGIDATQEADGIVVKVPGPEDDANMQMANEGGNDLQDKLPQ